MKDATRRIITQSKLISTNQDKWEQVKATYVLAHRKKLKTSNKNQRIDKEVEKVNNITNELLCLIRR